MARSVWKGPFVDRHLLKKVETVRNASRKEIIKTWSRRSTILPQFVGLTFGVHNGNKFVPGGGQRPDDRPQAWRIRADPHLQGPLGRRQKKPLRS